MKSWSAFRILKVIIFNMKTEVGKNIKLKLDELKM